MLATKTRKTFADYMKLPEEFRAELIEGEYFMCPSPNSSHQTAVVRFVVMLDTLVRRKRLGKVFVAPFDVVLSDETVVQPDVLFIAGAHLGRIRDRLHGAPDLVIEVLSPTSVPLDRYRASVPLDRDREEPAPRTETSRPQKRFFAITTGERLRDRIVKRDLYAQHGIGEYWLADPATRSIEILVLEGDRYRLHGILQPGDALCSPLLGDLTAKVEEAFE